MTILFAWLIADLFSGFIHYIQDRDWVWFRVTRADNDLHHAKPQELLKYSVWENLRISLMLAWPVTLVLFMIGAPTVIWLGMFFASFGNLIHRWAHMRRPHRIIRFLQRCGIFLSFEQHAQHHYQDGKRLEKKDARKNFCTMTSWLNPWLNPFLRP